MPFLLVMGDPSTVPGVVPNPLGRWDTTEGILRLMDYGFCRVYVDLSLEAAARAVTTDSPSPVVVEVRPNENRPYRLDDFIFWPTCVEIWQDGADSVDLGIVEVTRRVLTEVKSAGGRAVPSSDFEEQLQ